ncbi:MAG: AMP-binding protein [Egibacteraceae bacterium]
MTYREFAELVEGAVFRLREEGLRPGHRLAVAMHNCLDLAVALFACARGEFVMAGLNVRLRPTLMGIHARPLTGDPRAGSAGVPRRTAGGSRRGGDTPGRGAARRRPSDRAAPAMARAAPGALTGNRKPSRGAPELPVRRPKAAAGPALVAAGRGGGTRCHCHSGCATAARRPGQSAQHRPGVQTPR